MITSTKYERIKSITWSLTSHEVADAIRDYVKQKGLFTTQKNARSFTVDLDESGGAVVVWENVEDTSMEDTP